MNGRALLAQASIAAAAAWLAARPALAADGLTARPPPDRQSPRHRPNGTAPPGEHIPAGKPQHAATLRPAPPRTECVPLHRVIVAADIENSTSRANPVKAELRRTIYDLIEDALHTAGIHARHRDPFTDRGDGLLALIHPVDHAPKTLLLNQAIPALAQHLTDHNTSPAVTRQPERQLRLRVVLHAGDVHYDPNGCFGDALDLAFRLLDAAPVKHRLQLTPAPLVLVISDDIYRSVVRHGYDGIDQHAFAPGVHIQLAGEQHRGWTHIPGHTTHHPLPATSRAPASSLPDKPSRNSWRALSGPPPDNAKDADPDGPATYLPAP
jgi:class 3 adenylate cyclase